MLGDTQTLNGHFYLTEESEDTHSFLSRPKYLKGGLGWVFVYDLYEVIIGRTRRYFRLVKRERLTL